MPCARGVLEPAFAGWDSTGQCGLSRRRPITLVSNLIPLWVSVGPKRITSSRA